MLACSLLLTCAASAGLFLIAEQRDEARFRNATESVQDNIRARLDTYLATLVAARSLFVAQRGEVALATFQRYVAGLEVERRYPGIRGIGFAQRFAAPERHAVVFLEPQHRQNRAALGYDMSSEPVRREAMARARDTGEPAISGPVSLLRAVDSREGRGFLIFVPVYRSGALPSDVMSRQADLIGFVYSPCRVDELLADIFGSEHEPRVSIALFDESDLRQDTLLLRTPDAAEREPRFATTVTLPVAGRVWSLEVASTPSFEQSSAGRFLPAVMALGLLANVALFLVTRAQVRARSEALSARRAAEHAAARLTTLAETASRLSRARLDLNAVMRTVCREVQIRLADSCTIQLLSPSGDDLELGETCHLDPESEGRARALLSTPVPVAESQARRVVESGETALVQRTAEGDSLVIVPLRAAELVIGAMTASRGAGTAPFTADDERLLQEIADRAAFAVENARLAERLQRAVRVRDDFLSVAGHELKTPLAALQLQVQGLQRQAEKGAFGPPPPRLIDRLAKAQGQVERLEALTGELLDVSRIAAGKLALQLEEVDLAVLLADIAERFGEQLSEARCELSLRANERVVGRWDRVRLDQVFTNLVSNAIKYGAGKPIDIAVERADDRVRVAVHDRGIGISPEDRPRVFGRFERAVSERNYGGLGLGLWISLQIVHALGGTIDLESSLGAGSTFTVELPLSPREAA